MCRDLNIYIYMCVCVCVCMYIKGVKQDPNHKTRQNKDCWEDGPMGSVGVSIGISKLKIDGDC